MPAPLCPLCTPRPPARPAQAPLPCAPSRGPCAARGAARWAPRFARPHKMAPPSAGDAEPLAGGEVRRGQGSPAAAPLCLRLYGSRSPWGSLAVLQGRAGGQVGYLLRPVRGGFVRPPRPRSSGWRCRGVPGYFPGGSLAHRRPSPPACICEKNKRVTNCKLVGGVCWCDSIGSGVSVNCNNCE